MFRVYSSLVWSGLVSCWLGWPGQGGLVHRSNLGLIEPILAQSQFKRISHIFKMMQILLLGWPFLNGPLAFLTGKIVKQVDSITSAPSPRNKELLSMTIVSKVTQSRR